MALWFLGLAGISAAAMYAAAARNTSQVSRAIASASRKTHMHQMLGVLLLVAHASEIGHVVEHLSLVHVLIALFIFAMWMGTRSGEELA